MRFPGLLLLPVLLLACDRIEDTHHHHHDHTAPHGGTVVILGNEDYHLEFLVQEGRIHCYVLDHHLENFVRIDAPSLELVLDSGETLALLPVASRMTGESAGDTSHFAADWPRTGESFKARISEVAIRGTSFRDVPVSHPESHE